MMKNDFVFIFSPYGFFMPVMWILMFTILNYFRGLNGKLFPANKILSMNRVFILSNQLCLSINNLLNSNCISAIMSYRLILHLKIKIFNRCQIPGQNDQISAQTGFPSIPTIPWKVLSNYFVFLQITLWKLVRIYSFGGCADIIKTPVSSSDNNDKINRFEYIANFLISLIRILSQREIRMSVSENNYEKNLISVPIREGLIRVCTT